MTCIAFHDGVLYADRMSVTYVRDMEISSDICKLYKGKEGKVAMGFCGELYDEATLQHFTDAIEAVVCMKDFRPRQMSKSELFEFIIKKIDNSNGIVVNAKARDLKVLRLHGLVITSSHVFYIDIDEISMPNTTVPFAVGSGYSMFLAGVFLGHEPKDIYAGMSCLDNFLVSEEFDCFKQSDLLPIDSTEKDVGHGV